MPLFAADLNISGAWTKTTHPDPRNITLFFQDNQVVKAIGLGKIAGKYAIWYAEGTRQNERIIMDYRYGEDATPDGWEPEGTIELVITDDRSRMFGVARSKSGTWSGKIEFLRLKSNDNNSI